MTIQTISTLKDAIDALEKCVDITPEEMVGDFSLTSKDETITNVLAYLRDCQEAEKHPTTSVWETEHGPVSKEWADWITVFADKIDEATECCVTIELTRQPIKHVINAPARPSDASGVEE